MNMLTGSSAPLPPEPQPFCGGNVPILLFAPSRACDLGGFGPLGSAGGPRIVRSYRAGTQQRLWDARELPAGSYIVRLVTPEHISTQRVIHR